eukprot:TRINITY_DN38311_c0_g1_i1.p1 TRINITY_DN38311_c0_g1~~TRINITY_DN38311_c0_g1_i1.p1  ORF type:complete len:379 (-),score=46.00 TRINITY_DN38311_c0_g1_i1:153-1289(-)
MQVFRVLPVKLRAFSLAKPLVARKYSILQKPKLQRIVAQVAVEKVGIDKQYVMEDAARFIKQEFSEIFKIGNITKSRYAEDIVFQDPVVNIQGIDQYQFMLSVFKTLFNNRFQLLSIEPSGGNQLRGRFTGIFELWALPWRPELKITGESIFTIDPATGKILKHQDIWDKLDNNNFVSIEGVADIIRSILKVSLKPNLESPEFLLLKKNKDYEIRSYQPFMVAETSMGEGSGPAGASGFNDLAGYLFGGNDRNVSMEMTTPVLTTGGKMYGDRNRMKFVMEKKYGNDPTVLPQPKNEKVSTKVENGGIFGVSTFSGWPLDFEVAQAEKKLRDQLIKDGFECQEGYELARYNEPTVPPFLRRNEVLIAIVGVQEQDFYK